MISSGEEKNWIEGINKNKSDVKDLLEERIKTLEPVQNFNLSNVNLENILTCLIEKLAHNVAPEYETAHSGAFCSLRIFLLLFF